MIEKTFPYSIKIHNYSSISYKLFDLRLQYLYYLEVNFE